MSARAYLSYGDCVVPSLDRRRRLKFHLRARHRRQIEGECGTLFESTAADAKCAGRCAGMGAGAWRGRAQVGTTAHDAWGSPAHRPPSTESRAGELLQAPQSGASQKVTGGSRYCRSCPGPRGGRPRITYHAQQHHQHHFLRRWQRAAITLGAAVGKLSVGSRAGGKCNTSTTSLEPCWA